MGRRRLQLPALAAALVPQVSKLRLHRRYSVTAAVRGWGLQPWRSAPALRMGLAAGTDTPNMKMVKSSH